VKIDNNILLLILYKYYDSVTTMSQQK